LTIRKIVLDASKQKTCLPFLLLIDFEEGVMGELEADDEKSKAVDFLLDSVRAVTLQCGREA
jgi:hypothetical protein